MKTKRRFIIFIVLAAGIALAVIFGLRRPSLMLTGIVTTDEVIVSSEMPGRIQELKVKQGDAVTFGQLVAVVAPAEMKADLAYYESVERTSAAQVGQAEAELHFQQEQTNQQVKQAEANLATAESQVIQAQSDLDLAGLNFERAQNLRKQGANSLQDFDLARTGADNVKARVSALQKQVVAAQAAVDLAKAGGSQINSRKAAVAASQQQRDAATAQKQKADVHLGYTQVHAPSDGVINVRAALAGEVVAAGQPIVTIVNPNDLWVRVDVEESYIDRIHLGDKLTVRLPSGVAREGTIFFRGVDADYATQRDVSRTKRDIKTFEVRLRCDNRDRDLAVGMTASVALPLPR